MLVLDGLRKLKDNYLHIPQFHLGHLGFVPDLPVCYRKGDRDDLYGQEVVLTPFHGGVGNLFLFKCVFHDRPGVVMSALQAFSALGLNIVSLESATVHASNRHVLFCILNWGTSQLRTPMPLDPSTRSKLIDLLPLLPIADLRYLILIETMMVFCGETLDYDIAPGVVGAANTPKIYLRLFDTFDEAHSAQHDIFTTRTEERSAATVKLDLNLIFGSERLSDEVFFFSETETKTLRVTFPSRSRSGYFLHIAFVHRNAPGALLAISTLIKRCGFNIITSLLRTRDQNNNTWEVMLERTECSGKLRTADDKIPEGYDGVMWFRDIWLKDPLSRRTAELRPYMLSYDVRVCRPNYPRKPSDPSEEFYPVELVKSPRDSADFGTLPTQYKVDASEIQVRLAAQHLVERANSRFEETVKVIFSDFATRLHSKPIYGRVFLSIPAYKEDYKRMIEAKLGAAGFEVDSFIKPLSLDNMEVVLKKIRDADYFFGVWHHEVDRFSEISPWLPFEYGIARAHGKPAFILPYEKVRNDIRKRLDPGTSWITYGDSDFSDRADEVVDHCRKKWRSDKLILNLAA